MANDVYKTIKDCRSYASTRETTYTHLNNLKMFPEICPFNFVAVNVLGPLPKTALGRQYIFVITDQYSKVTRAITTDKRTASHIASILRDS